MSSTRGEIAPRDATRGLLLGFLGVLAFGLTFPMTRIGVAELDPVFFGLGRSVVAAVLAAAALFITRQPLPTSRQWWRLTIVVAGVIIGFPALSAIAMRTATAGHAGVVTAILPLATAAASVVLAGERPSLGFWIVGLLGSFAVLAFMVLDGALDVAHVGFADLLLLGAIAAAAVGYTEGAVLSRQMGGWQVISWALVLAAPLVVIIVSTFAGPINWQASWSAWATFAYVAIFSQFLGFFAWYSGLALGGVAKVGQVQLLQTFVTLAGAAFLVGEPIGWLEIGFAAVVVGLVALGRRMRVAASGR